MNDRVKSHIEFTALLLSFGETAEAPRKERHVEPQIDYQLVTIVIVGAGFQVLLNSVKNGAIDRHPEFTDVIESARDPALTAWLPCRLLR